MNQNNAPKQTVIVGFEFEIHDAVVVENVLEEIKSGAMDFLLRASEDFFPEDRVPPNFKDLKDLGKKLVQYTMISSSRDFDIFSVTTEDGWNRFRVNLDGDDRISLISMVIGAVLNRDQGTHEKIEMPYLVIWDPVRYNSNTAGVLFVNKHGSYVASLQDLLDTHDTIASMNHPSDIRPNGSDVFMFHRPICKHYIIPFGEDDHAQ